uniref:G-protein coupled receptors family 1 profile domain-containing protein n=1 Tax=Nothobranchius korthausae TaxID=1143690 RepID=A0A1A8FZT1_9TELE
MLITIVFCLPDMLMMSSSSYNGSVLQSNHSYGSTFMSAYLTCLTSRPSSIIFSSYIVLHISLHLPLSVLILYRIFQQTKQCPFFSAAPMSHSDCFTYHLVIMELIGVLGFSLCLCGIYIQISKSVLFAGSLMSSFTWFGEICFHILTCFERYLAVVHPVTYLGLKKERGIRIRNVVIGCVWLLCCLGIGGMPANLFIFVNFGILFLSTTLVSSFSISVLIVLIQTGPGDKGKGRERVDQSKQKAFYIIVVILGVLLLRFTWGLYWAILNEAGGSTSCVLMTVDVWFNLPSTLVQPLLFLFRVGKTTSCK